MLKPDNMSVVTVHMVYFCAFARFQIFPKNARELGVGRGQLHSTPFDSHLAYTQGHKSLIYGTLTNYKF